ncbi:MAG: sulfotransferase [Candidatus Dormibacteria bacterium]
MLSPYLVGPGKRLLCDKSISTVDCMDVLDRVYPDARLIFLYRNCLDVVHSALDVCRWSLRGYGFEEYVLRTPGNLVDGLVDYWVEKTGAMLDWEQRSPQRCLRLRYEDLVREPESSAAAVFGLLGLRWEPGMLTSVFTTPHEPGAGDHAVAFTKTIEARSLGLGSSIPLDRVSADRRDAMNPLLDTLGYPTVEDGWNDLPSSFGNRPAAPAAYCQRVQSIMANVQCRQALPSDTGDRAVRSLRVVVDDCPHGSWVFAVPASAVPGVDMPAEVTVTMSSHTLIAIIDGRLNLGKAWQGAQLRSGAGFRGVTLFGALVWELVGQEGAGSNPARLRTASPSG